mgnify:CR=1 FL=1
MYIQKSNPAESKVNIIPFIIGDTVIVLEKRNQEELNKIVLDLTKSSKKELKLRFADSRSRAIENFDIEIRKKKLVNIIMNIKV